MGAGVDSVSRRRMARGFSMIEVLVVMVIISILAAIAIPMYVGQRDRAKNASAVDGGHTIMMALLSYVAEQDEGDGDPWPPDCTRDLLVDAGVIRAAEWPANPFTDGEPMRSEASPSYGDYLYRPAPGDHVPPVRHQIVVCRKNVDPFVIP